MTHSLVPVPVPPAEERADLPNTDNPYKVLGVKKRATNEAITAAYRRLARMHHPDRRGSPEDFKRIKAAYELLINAKRRARFDRDGFSSPGKDDPTIQGSALEIIFCAFSSFFQSMEQHLRDLTCEDLELQFNLLNLRQNDPVSIISQGLTEELKGLQKELRLNKRVHKQFKHWKPAVRSVKLIDLYQQVIDQRLFTLEQAIKRNREGILVHIPHVH